MDRGKGEKVADLHNFPQILTRHAKRKNNNIAAEDVHH